MSKSSTGLVAGDLKEGDFFIPLNPEGIGLEKTVYQVDDGRQNPVKIRKVINGITGLQIEEDWSVKPISKERGMAYQLFGNVSYHYFTEVATGGAAVVAVAESKECIYWGVSYCSPEDQFVKIQGRGLALSRMLSVTRWAIGQPGTTDGFRGFIYPGAPNIAQMKRHELSEHILDNCARRPQWAAYGTFYPRNKFKDLKTVAGGCCCSSQGSCEDVQSETGGCAG